MAAVPYREARTDSLSGIEKALTRQGNLRYTEYIDIGEEASYEPYEAAR